MGATERGREKDVPAATRVIADTSAHEFRDGNDLFGTQYKQVLGWRSNAWDVYMVFTMAQHGALAPLAHPQRMAKYWLQGRFG